jgi:4-hydroxyacetophenone monooxygenase
MGTVEIPQLTEVDWRETAQGEPLSEAEAREAVAAATTSVLLMVIFQMTGEEKWLRAPYVPPRKKGLTDQDGADELQPEIRAEILEAGAAAVLALQAGQRPAVELPSPDLTAEMMSVCVGEPVDPKYGPMLAVELARRIAPESPGLGPKFVEPKAGFKVVVIGAGVSGIVAAYELERMGVDYVLLDKQAAPGGTWWQNVYPGAGVDTPSHLYSFCFAKHDWGRHFELREELQDYFARVMREVGGQRRARYGTEVVKATYDEPGKKWELEIRNPDGSTETIHTDVLLSAVGILNRPTLPTLPGMDAFSGPQFHSADWPEGIDLKGKRVAIVGTGASAMQIGPAITAEVEQLTIFQRTPQWVAPFENFMQDISLQLRRLLETCPLYHGWYWLRLFWQFGDRVIEALRVDPNWEHPERAVNARNDAHRKFFTRYIESQLEGRPDLIEKAIPGYPPFGKRILLDNGWYAMLKQPNVELVTEAVSAVTEHAVVTGSSQKFDADVIIWATGFEAARFVSSLDIRGTDGRLLREVWDDDDPRAYLGVSVPGFPNFFMLGGPNSFPGSGSFMFFMEVQMRYIRHLLNTMFERGIDTLEVSEEANDTYNAAVDAQHEAMIWTHKGMKPYQRNERGRVVFLTPFLNIEYWEMMAEPKLEDYVVG